MAGTVQRLIRHVFDTVGVPIALQNKMFKFTEDSDASRDRSRIVAQGPTGLTHEWWTVEEAQDYISNEISSIGTGNSSPFVLVTNLTEFTTAMSLSGVINIFCDDGSGKGIEISSTQLAEVYDIELLTSKNIYGAGGVALNIIPDSVTYPPIASIRINFNYPTVVAGPTVSVNFFDGIMCSGSGQVTLVANQGDSDSNHELRYTSIIQNGTSTIALQALFVLGFHLYEVMDVDSDNLGSINAEIGFWSGKNSVGKSDSLTLTSDSPFREQSGARFPVDTDFTFDSIEVGKNNFYKYNTPTGVFECMNVYYRESNGWWLNSGETTYTIKFIGNDGSQIQYSEDSPSLPITFKEVYKRDKDGNVSYGGATIPTLDANLSDSSSLVTQEFHIGGKVIAYYNSYGKSYKYTMYNCYIYKFLQPSAGFEIKFSGNAGETARYTIESHNEISTYRTDNTAYGANVTITDFYNYYGDGWSKSNFFFSGIGNKINTLSSLGAVNFTPPNEGYYRWSISGRIQAEAGSSVSYQGRFGFRHDGSGVFNRVVSKYGVRSVSGSFETTISDTGIDFFEDGVEVEFDSTGIGAVFTECYLYDLHVVFEKVSDYGTFT
jgi:hypothetical protein